MARLEPPIKTGLTFEDYLAFEETATDKHEFVEGQLFMMAGSSDKHNRIAFLLAGRLEQAAHSLGYRVFLLDIKVRTPNDVGYYPDVLVVCDDTDDHPVVKHKPCLIIEVLSDRTEATDRGEKLNNYRLIPSLQAYVLINQNVNRAEVYRRATDGTWRYEVYEDNDVLSLSCVGLEIEVASIYQNL
jgi:Uma2 family endonuclease